MRLSIPLLVLASLLAGCAPPALTIASLIADGVSYAATGKSTTDHAISAVVREDCALLRVILGEAVCDPDGEVLFELQGTAPSARDRFEPDDYFLRGGTDRGRRPAKEIATAPMAF